MSTRSFIRNANDSFLRISVLQSKRERSFSPNPRVLRLLTVPYRGFSLKWKCWDPPLPTACKRRSTTINDNDNNMWSALELLDSCWCSPATWKRIEPSVLAGARISFGGVYAVLLIRSSGWVVLFDLVLPALLGTFPTLLLVMSSSTTTTMPWPPSRMLPTAATTNTKARCCSRTARHSCARAAPAHTGRVAAKRNQARGWCRSTVLTRVGASGLVRSRPPRSGVRCCPVSERADSCATGGGWTRAMIRNDRLLRWRDD
jgi:hypothetical protein